jgi:hypothetical protein
MKRASGMPEHRRLPQIIRFQWDPPNEHSSGPHRPSDQVVYENIILSFLGFEHGRSTVVYRLC